MENYEREHLHRLRAQPGITGMWQVSGRKSAVSVLAQVAARSLTTEEKLTYGQDARRLMTIGKTSTLKRVPKYP